MPLFVWHMLPAAAPVQPEQRYPGDLHWIKLVGPAVGSAVGPEVAGEAVGTDVSPDDSSEVGTVVLGATVGV